jgi:glycosyltransferase involved in cell wall biosynthesis
MRVLHIIGNKYLPSDPDHSPCSGVVRVALEIAYRQVEIGHEVTILGIDTNSWQEKWKGVQLVCKKPIPFAKLTIFGHQFDLSMHLPFVIFTQANQFDLIHDHHGYLRLLKAKYRIGHIHTDPFHYVNTKKIKFDYKIKDLKLIAYLSDAQIAVSNFIAEQISLGIPDKSKIYHIMNGVDINHFNNVYNIERINIIKRNLNMLDDDIVILFAGAITPEKGVIHLANAFSRLSDNYSRIHLVFAGASNLWGSRISSSIHTEYNNSIRKILNYNSKKCRAHFLGKINSKDLPLIYQTSDIVVIPSVCNEACPLVVLEAMACGKPVIASNVGGLPEIVSTENGILVEAGNVAELQAAIVKLAINPDLRMKLGANGRKTAEHFTWDRTVAGIEEVYHLIQKGNNR